MGPPKNFHPFSPYQTTHKLIFSFFFSILLIPPPTKHTLKLLKKKKKVETITHNNNYTHTYERVCIHKSWYKCIMVVLKLFDYISKKKKKKKKNSLIKTTCIAQELSQHCTSCFFFISTTKKLRIKIISNNIKGLKCMYFY